MFVVALQVAGVVGRFRRLSRIKGVGRLYPPCWTLKIDISCAQLAFEMDIYPFFGFFEADFIGDTEGVVILILPPVWHLKSTFQSELGEHEDYDTQDRFTHKINNWNVIKRFHLHSSL